MTDGDGNPATGPEPTVVVVGNLQEVRITKDVSVVGGGPALAGATLEYVVQATNVGTLPVIEVVIRDDIAVPMPGYLTFVDQSWTLNGSTTGITVVGSLLTADYSTTYGALQPGRTVTLRFRAVLDANLAIGTRVTNTGTVYWNDPDQTASASAAVDVGGIPGTGLVNGRVWHDADFDRVFDVGEIALEGWTVELYLNDSLAHSARTAADGVYRLSSVEPNYATADRYEMRFRRPGAGRDDGDAGARAFRFHERSATHHGHRRAVGQQPAEPESADRAERHRLRRAVARAGSGRDRQPRRADERCSVAVGLFLR